MHILQEFREGVLVPVHVQTIEYVAAQLSETLEHLSGRLGESLTAALPILSRVGQGTSVEVCALDLSSSCLLSLLLWLNAAQSLHELVEGVLVDDTQKWPLGSGLPMLSTRSRCAGVELFSFEVRV